MKETDLRLGNIIEKQFLPDGHWDWGYYNKTDNLSQFPQCYRPLALSPEWLIRLGFKIDKSDNFTIISIEDSILLANWNSRAKEIHSIGVIHPQIDSTLTNFVWNVKYVHSLQNLIYAITGEELTLKP